MEHQVSQQLSKMFARGNEFLGSKYPIICGAMTWVCEPTLVSKVCNAGGFASIAGGNAPVDILEKQIEETRALTDKPFAVNLITIAPAYKEQLKLLRKLKHSHIVFAGSFPREKEIAIAKESGAKVMCFASTASIAERMIRYGADAIILEGSEAGGHIGHVSSMVLLQQILFEIGDQIPVFVGGGIATGKMMAHILMMGASGVQLGTRFVMTDECTAHPNFKAAFKKANAREATSTPQYDSRLPVVAVRALKNGATNDFGKLQLELIKKIEAGQIKREQAQIEVENFWMGGLRKAVVDGDIKSGSLMAGQSVGLVDKIIPVNDLMKELINDADGEIEKVRSLF